MQRARQHHMHSEAEAVRRLFDGKGCECVRTSFSEKEIKDKNKTSNI